jgi:mRNA interferase MazF
LSSVKTAISVEKSLLDKIDATAKNLSLSRSKFFAVAAENYLHHIETQGLIEKLNAVYGNGLDEREQKNAEGNENRNAKTCGGCMAIVQGDIYWVDLGVLRGSEPGFRSPYVVIQNDAVNVSLIRTVIVCLITSNLQRAKAPGNVLLEKDEANLSVPSVVNVSQVYTIDKDMLDGKVGKLEKGRVRQILNGLFLMLEPRYIF